MFVIKEVKDEAHFQRLRQNEDTTKDILYIRKYVPDMVMSDNGELIDFKFSSSQGSNSEGSGDGEDIDIEAMIQATLRALEEDDP